MKIIDDITELGEKGYWYKRGIFSSEKEYNDFVTYLLFIGMLDSSQAFDEPEQATHPIGWGFTQEEYEAALEFNKIYGQSND